MKGEIQLRDNWMGIHVEGKWVVIQTGGKRVGIHVEGR